MIAIDTSSLVAFLAGEAGADVEAVDEALGLEVAVLPPVVLTEILSAPDLEPIVAELVNEIPRLEIKPGFWQRAGALRASVLASRLRARLADTLIAQSCIDHGTPLVSRDSDFRHFAAHGGLELL